MLRLAIFHIFAIALAFSTIVWGVPITGSKNLVARGGACLVGCNTGTETLGILTALETNLQPKFKVLDDCYTSGTDPTNVMNEIIVLFNTASLEMQNLPTDMTGRLNDKAANIVNRWTSILTFLIEHFGKWNHKSDLSSRAIGDTFASLSAQLATAVTGTQSAVSGVLDSLRTLWSEILEGIIPQWKQIVQQLVGQALSAIYGAIGG